MRRFGSWLTIPSLVALLAAVPDARAQKDPHIGYIYPAGGQRGSSLVVTVGGQHLDGVSSVHISGSGLRAEIIEHKKPPTRKELQTMRETLRALRSEIQASRKKSPRTRRDAATDAPMADAVEMDQTADKRKEFAHLRRMLFDPKKQPNPQIAETVTLRITLAPDAKPGDLDVRLKTSTGLSNPLTFQIGQLAERCEVEPDDGMVDSTIVALPAVLNGQIMPGDVDRFRFKGRKGDHLVIVASARKLIPYLADAVPGWFQAVLTLYDAEGNEMAYADDFRFDPDPVISYEVPTDGEYVLEIRDAIYRGREDFVYRVAIGELPFVTSVFPMGVRSGDRTKAEMTGWNLPERKAKLDARDRGPGPHTIALSTGECESNPVRFVVGSLKEHREREPNDDTPAAQRITLPSIVNGRIDRPGDVDVFRIEGRAGDRIVAEVNARRLNSPLDAMLRLKDGDGRELAMNDDYEDRGAGLTTHHADSRLYATLPADGAHTLHVSDTQHHGSEAHAYRLRLDVPRPDFDLRVTPSSINARPGGTVAFTVHALRRDGFSGDILLELSDPPAGFALSGGWIPAGQDKVRLTLTVPNTPSEDPLRVDLYGRATIDGRTVRREAVPAEDMMQAFLYRHLVPARELLFTFSDLKRRGIPLRLVSQEPVRIPAGGTASVLVRTPRRRRQVPIQLALSESPEGITIRDVSPHRGGIDFVLVSDPDKVEAGLKGNLIVESFVERTGKPGKGKAKARKRRVPLGVLPAIPFEIVGP